jgi:uncharacterized protein YcbK (DUF882 family)
MRWSRTGLGIVATLAVATSAHGDPTTTALPPLPPPRTAARAPAPKRAQAAPVAYSKVWHTATAGKTAPVDDAGKPKLVLQGLNVPDRVELTARTERGGFSAEDLDRAAHVMRDHAGNEHPIDPRLLDLVYRVQTHFKAHEIRVLSGYRTPHHGSTSNHGKGRAMDMVVPGNADEDVAKFAREQGFVGVGVYPTSGFVHLDIRERSFFWIDTSGPGKKSRLRGILSDVAQKSDQQAAARGERPIGPFHIGGDVDAVVPPSAQAVAVDDEDSDSSSPAQ